jgi:hypothetical protein
MEAVVVPKSESTAVAWTAETGREQQPPRLLGLVCQPHALDHLLKNAHILRGGLDRTAQVPQSVARLTKPHEKQAVSA